MEFCRVQRHQRNRADRRGISGSRTSYVRDRAYSLAYLVHYDVTVQVDATAGDPEVLIEQKGIIPVAMTDLDDIEDEAWRDLASRAIALGLSDAPEATAGRQEAIRRAVEYAGDSRPRSWPLP